MRAFLAALASVVVIATGAMYVLDSMWQRRANEAYSTTAVRLPEHGPNTHNLVGKDWKTSRIH